MRWVGHYYFPMLATEAIEVRTAPVVNGRDIARQFYSIGADRLRLLRIENRAGALVRNHYAWSTYAVGVPPEASTAAELSALLASPDPSDILSALVFLAGFHEPEPGAPPRRHSPALFRDAMADLRVRIQIDTLTRHELPWIREAAAAATTGERTFPGP
ncbi:MAG: hypothetical protein R2729_18315 [Bryobacteraceae bacterium]